MTGHLSCYTKRMPTLEIQTPEGITLRREVAGPGSRYAAFLLDFILVTLIFVVLALVGLVIAGVDPSGFGGFGGLVIGMLIGGGMLVPAVYFWLCGHFMEGQTPGKVALGLRTVSADGYPATSWQLLLRSVLVIIDILPGAPVSAGFIIAMVTERRQRLGDMVAGTIVVEEPRFNGASEPYADKRYSELPRRVHEFASSVGGKLDKGDLDFLRDLLTRQGLEPELRQRFQQRAGKHYADRLGMTDIEDARQFLRELYLFLREAREVRA